MGFFEKKIDFSLLNDGDFIVVQTRVRNLELELDKLRSQIISLRGFVNRNLEPSAYKQDKPQTEGNINEEGLDWLQKHGSNSLNST